MFVGVFGAGRRGLLAGSLGRLNVLCNAPGLGCGLSLLELRGFCGTIGRLEIGGSFEGPAVFPFCGSFPGRLTDEEVLGGAVIGGPGCEA